MGIASTARIGRADLAIQRILASILFVFAAIFGLPALLMAGASVARGKPAELAAAAFIGLIAYGVGQLGLRLWSARPLPGWLIDGAFVVMLAVPFSALLVRGSWFELILFLTIAVPSAAVAWSASRRGYGWAPARKPAPFDDLA